MKLCSGSLSGQVENSTAVLPLAEQPSGRVVGGHGYQSEGLRGRGHRKRKALVWRTENSLHGKDQSDQPWTGDIAGLSD